MHRPTPAHVAKRCTGGGPVHLLVTPGEGTNFCSATLTAAHSEKDSYKFIIHGRCKNEWPADQLVLHVRSELSVLTLRLRVESIGHGAQVSCDNVDIHLYFGTDGTFS